MDDRRRVRHRCRGGVAGCSGNNAASSGPADPASAEPAEPTDPAPGDRTEAQASFDKAYDDAKMALDEAVKAVESAEALADAAATAEDRAAARKALSDAQDDLAAALEAARELPMPTDDRRRGLRVGLVSDAEEAQRAQNERIEDAQASTLWSAQEAFVRRPVQAALPEVGVVRRRRMNSAGTADDPDLLDDASFPAVPYEPGKVLISEGEASSGDPLRMRGFFPERMHDQSRLLGNSFSSAITYDGSNSDLPDTFFFAGLRITGTGLVIEMGGRGSDGTDLRRQVWLAPNTGPSSVYIASDPPYQLDDWVQHMLDCLGSCRLFDSRLRILCCRGGFHCGFRPSGFPVSGGFGCARILERAQAWKARGQSFPALFSASRPGRGLSTAFPHLCFSGSSGALRFFSVGALQAWKAMGNPPPVRSLVPGSGLGLPIAFHTFR